MNLSWGACWHAPTQFLFILPFASSPVARFPRDVLWIYYAMLAPIPSRVSFFNPGSLSLSKTRDRPLGRIRWLESVRCQGQ